MNRIIRILTAAIAVALIATPAFAQAKGYPSRTIECYAPSGAGGGWDLTIRTVSKTLTDTKLVKVSMPVENKSGGGLNLDYLVLTSADATMNRALVEK